MITEGFYGLDWSEQRQLIRMDNNLSHGGGSTSMVFTL